MFGTRTIWYYHQIRGILSAFTLERLKLGFKVLRKAIRVVVDASTPTSVFDCALVNQLPVHVRPLSCRCKPLVNL